MTPAYPPSWYAASTTPLPVQPALVGRIDCDVCVLGAGYTGLACALELAEAGYRVVVLEARRIGWGASGRNGGQAIVGFGCGERKLEALVGADDARRMFDLSREGLDWLHGRLVRHDIQAHWRPGHATVPLKPRQQRELQAMVEHFNTRYDHPVQWWDRQQLRGTLASDRYLGALYDPISGHLHPLAYALGLGRAAIEAGVRVFEQSEVTTLVRGTRPLFRTPRARCIAISPCWPATRCCTASPRSWSRGSCRSAPTSPPPRRWARMARAPDRQRHGRGRYRLGAGLLPARP